MQLYFAGAESPSHLNALKAAGVTRVAVNVTALSRRAKDLTGWASQERLEGLEWVLYADSPTTDVDAALSLLEAAEVMPEAIIGPVVWATGSRLGQDDDTFFVPTWDGIDRSQLRHFVETYGGVFLPDSVVDNQQALRTAQAATAGSAQGRALLGAITGRSKNLNDFEVVISSAWWAVQKHGETQVWDQGKLHRYNSKDKLTKRQQHRPAVELLGVNADAVLADDPAATVELAIKSWLRLEEHQARRASVSVIQGEGGADESVEVTRSRSAHPMNSGLADTGVTSDPPQARHGSMTLPVIGIEEMVTVTEHMDGTKTESKSETLTVTTQSLRKCNTCSLSLQCPSFDEQSSCAYNIPVMIRSKDQLQGVLRAMVEVQTQRVLFSRFGEEITGAPDPDVGREMDRLFGMVEKWKEIEDNRDTLELNMKMKGGGANAGMLSRLFGSRVGENAMALDTPIPSEAVTGKMTDG